MPRRHSTTAAVYFCPLKSIIAITVHSFMHLTIRTAFYILKCICICWRLRSYSMAFAVRQKYTTVVVPDNKHNLLCMAVLIYSCTPNVHLCTRALMGSCHYFLTSATWQISIGSASVPYPWSVATLPLPLYSPHSPWSDSIVPPLFTLPKCIISFSLPPLSALT